jgi:hypothetical protein
VNIATEFVLAVGVGPVPCDITLVIVEFEDSDELVSGGSDVVLNMVRLEDGGECAHGM